MREMFSIFEQLGAERIGLLLKGENSGGITFLQDPYAARKVVANHIEINGDHSPSWL
ncbi:hypothetical protein D9M68_936110 [compost metagenome]